MHNDISHKGIGKGETIEEWLTYIKALWARTRENIDKGPVIDA
jgi:hypothetical protein